MVQGLPIFRSIWQAWEHVQKFITNRDFYNDYHLHGERSIWWNLSLNNKPLALYQGCSTKSWAKRGISQFVDIFEHDSLIPWEDLKIKLNLPQSQMKTYNLIFQVYKDIPSLCHVDSYRFIKCKWRDGIVLDKLKTKNIYKVIAHNVDILAHVNKLWYCSFDIKVWNKLLNSIWKGPCEPKIQCFKWLLLVDRLPIRRDNQHSDICNICRLPEIGRHI